MNILVFIEQRDGAIKKSSLEAIRAAHNIATELSATVTGVAIGSSIDGLDTVGGYGASKVLQITHERCNNYSTTAYAAALAQIVNSVNAEMVFMPATAMGKDLAPRLAVKIDAGVAADITQLSVDNGDVLALRPIYAGKALKTLKINSAKKIFTLRPNVFTAGTSDGSSCPVETVEVTLEDADFSVQVVSTSISSEKLDVAEADVIVSGGRGLQAPEHWNLIEELADALGAATGASRAVVDAGWRPHSEQVGQTGKTVAPVLYVAAGISGAIQHLAGMSSSKIIVAINKDKDAPIFQIADYGIVGDVFEFMPAFTAELKKFLGK
jgi:electron transfer flavoprotein alpha subunit